MIHSVAVLAGESDYAEAAQMHAVRMAQWFHARLRVVTTTEPSESHGPSASGQSMESFGEREVAKISQQTANDHVIVESSIRGEGSTAGMLAEARGNDLLVVGLPPEPVQGAEPLLQVDRDSEIPLLHEAECLVLAVRLPPRDIRMVLVDYEGGLVGKGALRAAGEVAMRASASVTVLCVDGDPRVAQDHSATAERYLAGYGLASVATLAQVGQPGSAAEVARAAQSAKADLVVIGGEQHGLLNWLRDRTGPDPEDVAVFTQIPVLVAR